MIKKRTVIFLLITMAFFWTACDKKDADIASRPSVSLKVGEQTYQEEVYQYCWPNVPDDIDCDWDALLRVQPANKIQVTKGDEVRFVIEADEALGAPDSLIATVLDGPGGEQELETGLEAVYDVSLPDGNYRVRVDTHYNDVAGYEAFVSYVFGLEVAGIVLPTPTPLPTHTPTATLTPTVAPTLTFTPSPTLTPAATLTPRPTSTATTSMTPTPEATSTATPSPTAIPPTATPTSISNAPNMALAFGGQHYIPIGHEYCRRGPSSERICVESPFEGGTTARINFLRGTDVVLTIEGERPEEIMIEYRTDTGIPTGQPETRPGDNVLLLTITPEAGSYIMFVHVKWADAETVYYFRVSVSD